MHHHHHHPDSKYGQNPHKVYGSKLTFTHNKVLSNKVYSGVFPFFQFSIINDPQETEGKI